MNILGVGPAELAVVFIIMLVVAGPKRMIQWSFTLGRYVAQLRAILQETMSAVQKEFEDAGVEIPKNLPTIPRNFDVLNEVSKLINDPPKASTPTQSPESSSANAPTETPTQVGDEGQDSHFDSWLPK